LNAFTLLEWFERMEDDWSSCKLEKLLRPIASHPRASAGGGNDCNIHKESEK
jgi:hypothetical protein